ncbi:glucose-6-phosphate dehydrogenase [Mangrovibacter plantisponsor]|uniref:Glucose-6-phosphate 1-dehydrogenase n=1 Tax=Mangrovibacter plantisponsor TaxID=451513 RepID=A0A317PWU8_9ENTR|nr:glucose-6-phosphate dehydrogenase [Mangrovibacter plantisponsor]PWW07586.1 glucose-6-phosphate 1-dehydrogenase [Mangrovibacter plantisponsor]
MITEKSTPACNIVIFGAKGDLTRRKLLPSLYSLEKAGLLHADTRIIGVGRAKWNNADYLSVAKDALESFTDFDIDKATWEGFSRRLAFFNLDVNDTSRFKVLGEMLNGDKNIYYFALPPSTFYATCKGLGEAKLNYPTSRVVMEKPLGSSLSSFKNIDGIVSQYFTEKQVYRIDHYLGKETVLNLLALRFANSLFVNNWDNRAIEHVQITVSEEIGIEGRWGYFDRAGQLKDMIQSHLLQILTLVAMSPPENLSADAIRDEKVKVLKALRPITKNDIRDKTVRGQYTAGFVQDKKVPGYIEETGANHGSHTETFAAIRVDIDNWRWAGVPFYLRTGKRMPIKCSEIVVYFRKPQINIFDSSFKQLPQNKLIIRLQPDEGIEIEILNKTPGLDHKHHLWTTSLDLSYSEAFGKTPLADAYERILFEAMCGVQTLFLRRDEIEAAWSWVDSIVDAWENDGERPKPYRAGTWGPVASDAMITREGYSWSECS